MKAAEGRCRPLFRTETAKGNWKQKRNSDRKEMRGDNNNK
jgi:hypothetical protein